MGKKVRTISESKKRGVAQESGAGTRREFLASRIHLIKRRKNNCVTLSSTQSTPNTELRKTSGLVGNRERMESGGAGDHKDVYIYP